MPDAGCVVVVGGTRGIGLEIARDYAGRGGEGVGSGREGARAHAVAKELGGRTLGIGLELALPEGIAAALAEVGHVDHLVLAAIDRDDNTVRDYDIARALRLVTLKLVGYTEVVHQLVPRMDADSSVLVFGDRPFWSQKPEAVLEGFRSRTPTGRLATMQDVVGAVVFLLENRSVNGVELDVDGGWLML